MISVLAAVLASGLTVIADEKSAAESQPSKVWMIKPTATVVYNMKDGSERRMSMPLEDCIQVVYALSRNDVVAPSLETIGCYEANGQEWTGNIGNSVLMGGTDSETVAYYEALLDAGLLPPGATVVPPHFPVSTNDDGSKFVLKSDGKSCKYVAGKNDYETSCEDIITSDPPVDPDGAGEIEADKMCAAGVKLDYCGN